MIRLVVMIAAAFTCVAVQAQSSYPSRPIKLVVAYPAGGPNDIVARLYGRRMGEILGQPMVIENRTGAGGNIGTAAVAQASADGYTLLAGASAMTIAPSLTAKPGYNVTEDFVPIGLMARSAFVLAASPATPVRSVTELIAYARAHPGKLNYGSAGIGTPPHLAAELLMSMAKITMTHVPFRGVSQSINDLAGGQIDVMFTSLPLALPMVGSGKLRALGVSSARRSSLAPDIPSVDEAGVKGFELATWWGLLAPAGTSPAIVARLSQALLNVGQGDEAATQLGTQGLDLATSTPEAFAAHIRSELATFARLVKAAGITAN